jgi:excinuclease ABC subunit A
MPKKTKTSWEGISDQKIVIRGARTHNLRNIDLEIPRNKMVVFTGLSGSGKSSLAFDTIFAEGQRRYVESLSSYARQFLRQMQKPDVDEITGLSPAISIDQKSASRNPRSTVATITEIYDYLRILYARIGQPYCLNVDVPIQKLSQDEILGIIMKSIEDHEIRKFKTDTSQILGVEVSSAKVSVFAPIVVGRKGEYYQVLYDLLSKGYETVRIDGEIKQLREKILLSKTHRHDIDVLIDEIYITEFGHSPRNAQERLSEAVELALRESNGLVKVRTPDGNERMLSAKFICPTDGSSFPEVEPRLFSFNSPYGACPECNGLGTAGIFNTDECPSCRGARLRPEALRVYVGGDGKGSLGKNIVDFTDMTIGEAADFIAKLKLSNKDHDIAWPALREIIERLEFMINVGIEYLTLNRRANTLSGGEAQRIRLASQLGSGLVGAMYVLDEPTVGLHQRDNERLIKTLTNLRNLGNTIIVVEHDEDTILASDYMVDIGPGAGVHGGKVVVAGYLSTLLDAKNTAKSVTLDYLRGEKKIEVPNKRREGERGSIKIRGGKAFNIKNLNVDIPLGRFIAVTGVSGSGKSTFMYEILHRNLRSRLDRKYRTPHTYNAASVTGTEYLGRSILIEQSPIGRTPRSNPATYTGAFTHIRDLFASTNEARARGWKSSRFSFNVRGGRCEACQGNGEIAVEMHFLPTVFVTCDVCDGKRFTKETLEILYKKKNINQVLHMTIEEAGAFFNDIPAIHERLQSLLDVGLGYLELGQSATTLSGGEAQRVKIASELYRPHTQKTMYLLDEPTIGLHYEDVKRLIEILQELVNRGNTVMVIEHNLDLIKSADYIIDIGPEGGEKGGGLVAKGTPEEVALSPKSHTGKYIQKALNNEKRRYTENKRS